MTHEGAHERDSDEFPLLCDGCPRCEQQAGENGLFLDPQKWARAWEHMLDVEIREIGAYRSAADKKLCRSLYTIYLILERNTWIDPDRLIPPATVSPRRSEEPSRSSSSSV